jgi:DNA-binding PadR family transcriptional regulator
MKDVERESAGEVRLELGSLYRLLARLLDEGLIQSSEPDGRRRLYSLTPLGRSALQTEARHLASVLKLMRARNLGEARS